MRFEVIESETDTTTEVTATLELKYCKWDERGWRPSFKRYHGKSVRPLKKKTRRKKDSNLTLNVKEEMEKEAQKAALMECYKEYFGFTEFNDILVDELGRPVCEYQK